MNELTPREYAYIQILQGILSSNQQMSHYSYQVVHDAIKIGDILFEQLEQRRKENNGNVQV